MRLQVEFRVTPDVVKLVSRLHSPAGRNTEPTNLYALGFIELPSMLPFCNCNVHLIAQRFTVIIDLTEHFHTV